LFTLRYVDDDTKKAIEASLGQLGEE
jgi:hypothetical protein